MNIFFAIKRLLIFNLYDKIKSSITINIIQAKNEEINFVKNLRNESQNEKQINEMLHLQ